LFSVRGIAILRRRRRSVLRVGDLRGSSGLSNRQGRRRPGARPGPPQLIADQVAHDDGLAGGHAVLAVLHLLVVARHVAHSHRAGGSVKVSEVAVSRMDDAGMDRARACAYSGGDDADVGWIVIWRFSPLRKRLNAAVSSGLPVPASIDTTPGNIRSTAAAAGDHLGESNELLQASERARTCASLEVLEHVGVHRHGWEQVRHQPQRVHCWLSCSLVHDRSR